MTKVTLPSIVPQTTSVLTQLTNGLEIPRTVLASDAEIDAAWTSLPSVITKIPPEFRNEQLARACVAIGVGLFDSAINYVWNLSVVNLRSRVKTFGLSVVGQLLDKAYDEAALLDLKDAQLLDLCLKLNLIDESAYFYLDQCRDIRNNFAAAHASMGDVDEHEVISFINRCAKYALSSNANPKGVDAQKFINAVKQARFSDTQKDKWIELVSGTHEAQREILFLMLHGIYCDPNSSEESRVNSLTIIRHFSTELTPQAQSSLVDRHSNYIAEGKSTKHAASTLFFEKAGLLHLLSEPELHLTITNATKRLMSAHQGLDNFYNEPPFAERLRELLDQSAVPTSSKAAVVEAVVTCATGNPYGISHGAWEHYEAMVKSFSPAEIDLMLKLPSSATIVAQRIKDYSSCRERFKALVGLIDESSIPASQKSVYAKWKA